MHPGRVWAVLAAPVIVGVMSIGTVAAADVFAAHEAAAADYAVAYGAAQDARAAALGLQGHVSTSERAATGAIADAEAVRGTPFGLVTADDATNLAGLVDQVANLRMPDPGSVPALPRMLVDGTTAEYREALGDIGHWRTELVRWAEGCEGVTALDTALLALRGGTFAAAGTAAATAQAALDGSPMASEDSRAALAAAIAELNGAIGARNGLAAEISTIASATQAVRDSHAAVAAAAAETGGSSGSDVGVHPPALYCTYPVPTFGIDPVTGEDIIIPAGPPVCVETGPLS